MSSNVATIRKQGFLIRNTRNYLIAHSFGIIIKKDRPFGQDPCLRSRTQSKYRSHLNDTPSVDQKRKTVSKKRFGHVFCVFRKPTTYNLGPYVFQILFDQKTNSRDHVDMMFLGIRSTTEVHHSNITICWLEGQRRHTSSETKPFGLEANWLMPFEHYLGSETHTRNTDTIWSLSFCSIRNAESLGNHFTIETITTWCFSVIKRRTCEPVRK